MPEEPTTPTTPAAPTAADATPTDQTDEQLEQEVLDAAGIAAKPPEKPDEEEAQAVPAEAPAAEPAQPAAEGGGDAGGTAPADEPAPAAVEVPVAAPAVVAAPQPVTPQVDPIQAEIETLTEQILGNELEITDEKKAMLRRSDLVALQHSRQVEAQIRSESDFYSSKSAEYGVGEQQLKAAWRDELKKAEKRFGQNDAARAVATVAWEQRFAKAATPTPAAASPATPPAPVKGAPVKPPIAKTPITPKGAQVVPPGAVTTPPPPKKDLSDEEELVATMRTVPGGLRALVR